MNQLKITKWVARIFALIILLFGLPFYFGYGNPLPFINPEYSWLENTWLLLIPFVFIGLAVGWKYEKIGGYFIIVPIIISFVLGIVAHANFSMNFLIALLPGILYLIVGHTSKS